MNRALGHFHSHLALVVEENIMHNLSAFLLFFGDKKELLVKALYTFPKLICHHYTKVRPYLINSQVSVDKKLDYQTTQN